MPHSRSRSPHCLREDNGADERIAPSLDVCDVSIAKLAVTERLADCGHVDPEAPFSTVTSDQT